MLFKKTIHIYKIYTNMRNPFALLNHVRETEIVLKLVKSINGNATKLLNSILEKNTHVT